MSVTSTTPGTARAAAATRSGPTFVRLLAAEWTKLTSLRSPWWVAGVTVAVAAAITYLSAQASSGDPGFQPFDSLSSGLVLAQVGPLVLGVLAGAGEYRTGAFRTTFTLVPRRWPVLAAQTLVVAAFALGLGVLATVACVLGVLPAAASRDIPLDLTAGETPAVLLAMTLFVVGLALLGFALGVILRRTVPAMVTALVVVLLLPVMLTLAGEMASEPADPASFSSTGEGPGPITVPGMLLTFSPGGAAQEMTVPASYQPVAGSPDMSPLGGGLVLGGWVLVLLAATGVRLRTRDVR
ncbi:hypothetical protein J4G33_04600 [Actinotalea sp. BY-33]|uniref:ABC transporter permease n=1 Tax=Actinotalea soli TaxID=2819234 RepID=A0A939LNX7_9CELL|nr:hypothetical protein [Actinotalea soli]MBO1751078.1 hypothetical protein [Actinotalea soli]